MRMGKFLLIAAVIGMCLGATGCSHVNEGEKRVMSSRETRHGSAEVEWLLLSRQIAATQAIVGGTWESVDTAAFECRNGGAQWGISRLGPGVAASDREALFERLGASWRTNGWDPVLSKLGGDVPGLLLRYPASGGLDDGFFVEIDSTEFATTIGAQTRCASGDVDALNAEHFAEDHSPGVTWPESSPPLP